MLQHVQLADVTAIDQPRLAEGVRDGDLEKLGFSVLVFGRTGPLLLERRIGSRLEYYLLPNLNHSTFPYRVGFPILAANLVEIGRTQCGLAEVRGSRTGVLPPLQLKPQMKYRVSGPAGQMVDSTTSDTGLLNGISAPAIGQYRVMEGGTEVARVGVSLLDSNETSLTSVRQLRFRENIQVAATSHAHRFGPAPLAIHDVARPGLSPLRVVVFSAATRRCPLMIASKVTLNVGRRCKADRLLTVSLLLLAAVFAVLPAAEAADQKPPAPIVGRIELRYRRCRSGAPIPVLWRIESTEPAITEGVLQYEVFDSGELLGRFQIPDVVVSPGKNEFNAVLPALSVHSTASQLTITPRLLAGSRVFEFDEQSLRVPTRFFPWYSVAVVSGAASRLSESETHLFEAVRLEGYLPQTDDSKSTATVSFEVRSDVLPTDALGLCNFDVLALMPAALAEIRDDQAEAIRKWVSAGGSLCVVAGGGLSSRHAIFLNDLFAEAVAHHSNGIATKSANQPTNGQKSPSVAERSAKSAGGSEEGASFVVDSRGFLSPGEKEPGQILSAQGLGPGRPSPPSPFEKTDSRWS